MGGAVRAVDQGVVVLAAGGLPGSDPIDRALALIVPLVALVAIAVGLFLLIRRPPGPSEPNPPHTGPGRDRQASALLAVFLGTIGAHKIYLRRWWEAVLYPLFFWSGVPTVLGILEGIWYLSLSDAEFRRRVVERPPFDPFRPPTPEPAAASASAPLVPGMPAGWDLCGACRTLNPIDARFCLRCGTAR
jgi:hypothetical protein